MENIVTAKKELYDSLKAYNEVVGASIRGHNGDRYIVILLSQMNSSIMSHIPSSFKGNKVTHEIIGNIRAL